MDTASLVEFSTQTSRERASRERLTRELLAARIESRHAQNCCAKAEAERDEARQVHEAWAAR